MEALVSLLIGDSQEIFKVIGNVPEVDQQLVDDLQAIDCAAWAEPSYGEHWLGISAEHMNPMEAHRFIEKIRGVLGDRGLKLKKVVILER
jgi:hypothetical protein